MHPLERKESPPIRSTGAESLVADLRASVRGRVIAPGDAEYDEARTPFYGGFDRRPVAIARVADADDAARVIAFARGTGIELAVRGGGHSPAAIARPTVASCSTSVS